jgi:hypothetical protein
VLGVSQSIVSVTSSVCIVTDTTTEADDLIGGADSPRSTSAFTGGASSDVFGAMHFVFSFLKGLAQCDLNPREFLLDQPRRYHETAAPSSAPF